MTVALSTADAEVSDALIAEINAIKVETGASEPTYQPQAWTREGWVD